MREFTLALAIAVASFTQVQAMPVEVPSTFPASGQFCGFMELCTPKAADEQPKGTKTYVKAPRPAK